MKRLMCKFRHSVGDGWKGRGQAVDRGIAEELEPLDEYDYLTLPLFCGCA